MTYQDPRYRDPEYRAKWAAANPEKQRVYAATNLERHREANRLRGRAHYAANREQRKAQARAYYRAHKAEQAATAMLRKYGITRDDYQSLVTAQGGRCAICDLDATLAVDHRHADGRVRGLLCSACNFLIGHGKDDPSLLRRAADYLESRP